LRYRWRLCAALLGEPAARSEPVVRSDPPVGARAVEAASASERLDRLQAALREVRGRGDWAAYLAAARHIEDLLNGSPQSRLEVARADVHAGDAAAALEELTTYLRMGQSSAAIDKLADFEALRARKEFDAIRAGH
jgi:hypothetical protein